MAYGKLREKLFLILSYFTCIALIQCRSLLDIIGDGSDIYSKRYNSENNGYGSFVNFGNLQDAGVSELQRNSLFQGQLVSPDQATWDAMSPKLRCNDDVMQLQLSGPEVAQVKLCRGNGAPVLLSRLPPQCGQVTPFRRGLVYATPYDGCGVMQQEGSYVMQMQWQGKPAVVSCRYLGEPLPMPVTTSAPTTTTAVAQAPPQSPGNPQMFWPLYYPYYYGAKRPTVMPPTAAPVTTTTTPAAQNPTQKRPAYPPMFWPFYPYYYGKPRPTGTPPIATTPVTTTTTAAPPAPPQNPLAYPSIYWSYMFPYYYGQSRPTGPPVTTPPTTTTTTTPVAQNPMVNPQFPAYPSIYWQYMFPYYYGQSRPTAPPVTTPTTTTTPVAQNPPVNPPAAYPPLYLPYYYPYYYQQPGPIETTTPPPPVDQYPSLYPQRPAYPPMFWPFYNHREPKHPPRHHERYPWFPTESPITTPQPCTTTTSDECTSDSDISTDEPHRHREPHHYRDPHNYHVPQRNVLYEKDPFRLHFGDSDFDSDSFP